jgi:hypothetical protein
LWCGVAAARAQPCWLQVDAMSIDLGDLKSVAAFVVAFRNMVCHGFESQFRVCHIGHFFLTTLLLDVAHREQAFARAQSIAARVRARVKACISNGGACFCLLCCS